jgi:RsiW-degrading membrane proteinase PrsW (M82 family)
MTSPDCYSAVLRQLPKDGADEPRQPSYGLSNTDTIILGRDPRCDIVIDPMIHRTVSRRHAEISPILGFQSPDGSRYWQVCDLGSANGTFLNGQRIQGCQVLQPGDRISLGRNGPDLVFEYQHPGDTDAAVPPVVGHPTQRGANLPRVAASSRWSDTVPPAPRPASPRRDSESISLTQLFPIFSTGRQLTQKAYLLPGVLTVAFVVLLFLAVGEPVLFNFLLAAYISGAAYLFIYQLCGKHKPWWLLASAAGMTALLLVSPVLDAFIYVFRELLPGKIASNTPLTFPVLLMKMFFGAGLMEELLKALPVGAIFLLGTQLKSPLRERLGVWEPLDGILLGAASAVGFTLLETLGQYVPETYKAAIDAGENAAQLASLQLLIPRVLGSVAGHMAYSGYLGYFIGLSVLRPRQRWTILGVGYLTASGLHALWNATGAISPVILAFVGVLSYAFLAAAILKARELSPTRSQNFATRFTKS